MIRQMRHAWFFVDGATGSYVTYVMAAQTVAAVVDRQCRVYVP